MRCINNREYLSPKHGVFVFLSGEDPTDLTLGRVYSVLEVEDDLYRIVDDSGEDYLYPRDMFQVLKND